MTLGEKQELFMELLPQLLNYIQTLGYKIRGGDLFAREGHKKNSNHYIKLAIDLNVFKNKVYLISTEDHKEFGRFWEHLHPLCRWGGRFQDGNHYSLEHEGRS